MRDTQVLIAGAGPTGLVLALWLTRLGVRVRVVDKTAEPGTTSRALAVHARTLELYRQIGLSDAVIERGHRFAAINLWASGRRVARALLGELGEGVTPFPFVIIFPQDEHERLLIERLAAQGVQVERRTELVGFEEQGDRVRARLKEIDRAEEVCEADYLAGCDGARSRVRENLGIGFPGGTYGELFYVADVRLSGPVADGELHVALDQADFLAAFPMKGEGFARLIGTVRPDLEARREELEWKDVSGRIVDRLRLRIERVNWFSTYHVHHRVADRFRSGRAFLLGDAAHIHSPVGGQGMNTGIGDAINLAWKLAAVVRGRMAPAILDSYEPERIAFARRLVATTDRVFTVATSRGPIAKRVRLDVVPILLPAAFRIPAMRRFLFRTVSQTSVTYRGGPLSSGAAGSIHGGDRLPWVRGGGRGGAPEDNFTPLASLDWQVHVYGVPAAALSAMCEKKGLALHVFPWSDTAAAAGLARDAAYIVRPDGYVALADPEARPETVESYLETLGRGFAAQPAAR